MTGGGDQAGGRQIGGRAAPLVAIPVLNIANVLTVARLLLIPVFLAALFAAGGHDDGWRVAAAVVYVLVALGDLLDGNLARSRGLVTDFGAIADPIVDKALLGSALVGLSVLGDLPWWVTVVIAVRELGVTGLRFWVIRRGVIAASRGGKLKAFSQNVAITCYLLPLPDSVDAVKMVVLGLALVLTVATGIDYLGRALRLRAVTGPR